MAKRLVFLVPGFFGFTSVGAVSYFERVERLLGRSLRRHGVEARIVRCRTQPTASIPRRADELRRQVIRRGGLSADELHFVGHSTGGLDVRMLLTPDVKIADGGSEERIGRLTRTAISVATPHHGTPLANHFLSLQGQTLLLVATALATSGHGRRTILAAAKAIAMAARLDDWLGRREGPLDRLAGALLRRIRFDRRDPVWRYLNDIERDQGALLQLTPEGIDLFDAAVADRAGVRYGCVVAAVPPPRLEATRRLLDRALGFETTAATNDGIVPTLSQLHGRVLHVARADHLDVVGHYTLAGGRTADWLPSGAGFTPEAFEATWEAVAAAIAGSR